MHPPSLPRNQRHGGELRAKSQRAGSLRLFQTVCRRCLLCGTQPYEIVLKKTARDGCIRESFVGNYAVDYEPGAHFPAMTLRSLQASAPSGRGLRKSATLTWLRFFIAAQISFRDSVCSRLFFWSDWGSSAFWGWRVRPIRRTKTWCARNRCSSATSITSAMTGSTAATAIPRLRLPPLQAFRLRKPA